MLAVCATWALSSCATTSGCARTTAETPKEVPEPHERTVRIPFFPPGAEAPSEVSLVTTVLIPKDGERFGVAILNHGSPRKASLRENVAKYPHAARWFLARGYAVVIPNRRGYGTSGGGYAERLGSCADPRYERAGRRSAEDIGSVVRWVRVQRWSNEDNIVVVGQSAGGWGALVVASENLRGVRAVVNFAGGRGSQGPNDNCSPEKLVADLERLSRTATIPALFVYTENDLAFSAELSSSLFKAWKRGTRGRAEYVLHPAFGDDGHYLFGSSQGPQRWGPIVERFLQTVPGVYCERAD